MFGQRWRYNKLRKALGQKRTMQVIAASVLGVTALVILIAYMLGEDDATKDWVEKIWFYDMNAKTLFPVQAGTVAPIGAPSSQNATNNGDNGDGATTVEASKAGVRAHVFGCGSCKDPFIAYLENFPVNEANAEADPATTTAPGAPSAPGVMIRRRRELGRIESDAITWLDAGDPANKQAITQLRKSPRVRCDGKSVVQCFPGNAQRFATR